MSQNQTLIGCLVNTVQDQQIKFELSMPYFILQRLFDKGHSNYPRQISVAGIL